MKKLLIILILLANIHVSAQLSGSYTVGSSSSDFVNLDSAINTLTNVGVNGPTILNILPGTYTGQWIITPISGASSTNTITFKAFNNDSTSVVLSGSTYGTIILKGADYIILKNLTINTSTINYSKAIGLLNSANNNTISNCLINVPTIISMYFYGIYDSTGNDNYNIISNNKISGGNISILCIGESETDLEKGTKINGNELINFYDYGIRIFYQDSLLITKNNIHDNAISTGEVTGIYSENNYEQIISENKINITGGTKGYGIYEIFCNYYPNFTPTMGPQLIANNFITINSGSNAYGIYSYRSNKANYFHNSIIINSGSNNSYALYQTNTVANMYGQSFKNNIFMNKANGYAAYFSNIATINECDYNDYYANGSNFVYFGNTYSNLYYLKLGNSNFNVHSISIKPNFISSNDLHSYGSSVNNLGVVTTIVNDIDGQTRSNSPDIGADEFDIIDSIFNKDTIQVCNSNYNLTTYKNFLTYKWGTGEVSPSVIINSSKWVNVLVSDSNNNYGFDSIYVKFITVNAGTNQQIICGGSVTLNPTSNYIGLQSNLNWKWKNLSGTDSSTSKIYIVKPIMTTDYTISLYSNEGCYIEDTVTISVISASCDAGSNISKLCGDSTSLYPSTNYQGASTNLNWVWNFDSTLNNINIKNPVAKTISSKYYYVSFTSNEGCLSNTDSVKITIAPMTVNAGNNITKICGDSVVLNPSTNYSGSPSNLNWTWNSDVTLINPNTKNPVAKTTSTKYYFVNLTSNEGCVAIKDSVKITINPMTVNAGSDVTKNCGDSLIFNPTTNFSGGASNLLWNWSPSSSINNASIKNAIAKPLNTTIYSVILNSTQGCIAYDTIKLTINSPTLNAGADLSKLCGESVALNPVTNYAQPNNLVWTWSPSIGLNSSNTKNVIATPIATTNYIVNLTSFDGCTVTDTIKINIAVPSLEAGLDKTINCGGNAYIIPITNYGGLANNLIWNWSPANGLNSTTNATQQAHPVQNTTYYVNYVSPEGCIAGDSVRVFVNSMTVNAGFDVTKTCGDSLMLNPMSNYGGSASNLIWAWSPTNGLSSTGIQNPKAKPVNTTNYVVNLSSSDGCFATDTVKFTVIPSSINLGNDQNIICGGSVALNPTVYYGGNQSNLNWSWSPNSGLSNSNIKNPLAKPVQNTSYQLSMNASDGCFAIDTILINVVPINLNAGNNITKLCGDSSILNPISNYPGNSSNLSWTWSPTVGLNSNSIQNPLAKPISTTNYILNLTSIEGCSAIDTILFLVNPSTVDAGNPITMICGDDTVLTPTFLYGGNPSNISWQWNPSPGLSSSNIKNPNSHPIQTTKYYLTITTPEGCSASDSMIVQIDPLIVLVPNDTSLVCGESFLINTMINYPGNNSNLTYLWSPATGLNNTNLANPTLRSFQNQTYKIQLSSIEGCQSSDSINISSLPLVVNAYDLTIQCGDTNHIIASINSNSPTIAYLWNPTTGLSNSTILNPLVTTTSSGNYHLIAKDSICSSGDSVQVIINKANYNLDFNANQTLFTAPPFAIQLSNLTPNSSNYNFLWKFGDSTNLSSNNSSVFHSYNYNGLYSINLVATHKINSCVDSLIKSDYIYCTGGPNIGFEDQNEDNLNFTIYPNPNNGFFKLSLDGTTSESYQIQISSVVGEVIYSETLKSSGSAIRKEIHLNDISKGLYFVSIVSEEGRIVKRFVVQ